MPVVKDVQIVKVPLSEKEKLLDYKPAFPRMPRLYLELLENKAKIKQDLINKEYIPTDKPADSEPKEPKEPKKTEERQTERPKEEHTERPKEEHTEIEEKHEDVGSKGSKKDTHSSSSTSKSDSDKDSDYGSGSDSDSSSGSSRSADKKKPVEDEPSQKVREEKEISEAVHDEPKKEVSSSSSSSSSGLDSSNSRSHKKSSADTESDLSVRLKELLGDTKDDKYAKKTKSVSSIGSKYSQYVRSVKVPIAPAVPTIPKGAPPTLAELEAKGQYHAQPVLRDVTRIPAKEYEDEDKKRELLLKFRLLKQQYKDANIADFTLHSELREMQRTYEDTLKELSINSTVATYKTYLVYGFYGVEFVFGKFLGFDMSGYTQQQVVTMSSYDRLLIELGEKSYVPSGSRWPVEVRLLGMIILNTGVFILGKMAMASTGANLMALLNGLTPPTTEQKQKRKMKGPNIDITEIPDVNILETQGRPGATGMPA